MSSHYFKLNGRKTLMKLGKSDIVFTNPTSVLLNLSTKQRIETKRHRVCLEVPEEVVPQVEDEDDEEQYGKRPRLSLIPPRAVAQDGKRNKGINTVSLIPVWQPRVQ